MLVPNAAPVADAATSPALLDNWLLLGSLTVPGRPEYVRIARRFVARAIGDDYPRADTALLLASELMTNAVLHSKSRLPGGRVTVVVAREPDEVLVVVADDGAIGRVPMLLRVAMQDGEAVENGNGLVLVASLADRWGCHPDAHGTTAWFRLCPPSGTAPALTGRPISLIKT
jgi:anti-sigma regulatory factor (Ser/Thr protein kinase)